MTFRLVIGIDPGLSGALAIMADDEPQGFVDMPTLQRENGSNVVNAAELAARLRGIMQQHVGAYTIAVLEEVQVGKGGMGAYEGSAPRRSMGSSSAMRFGKSIGNVEGVLGALGIHSIPAHPSRWKKHFGLTRDKEHPVAESIYKDRSRVLAIEMFPQIAAHLARKKDCGRAEALLMATWAAQTEQIAKAA